MLTPSPFSRRIGSERVAGTHESVIREMTRETYEHDAINFSQGTPDEGGTPVSVEGAAKAAIDTSGQYTVTWGLPELCEAVSECYVDQKGVRYDPETGITITTGTSETVVSTLLALCGPDDDVIYLEPTYENYIPAIQFAGGEPIPLDIADGLGLDAGALWDAAQEASTLILSHPHNPTGDVFSPAELELVTEIATEEDFMVVIGEIYEHIVYADNYVNPVEIDGLAGQTVVCAGLSKTYPVTGRRVGFALTPEPLSAELRKVHDYTSICAPTPFQRAGIETLSPPAGYYDDLSDVYEHRGELLYGGPQKVGLDPVKPDGAYYMLTRYPDDADNTEFAHRLVREADVAVVPGSSLYTKGSVDRIRFTFSRDEAATKEALQQLNENRF